MLPFLVALQIAAAAGRAAAHHLSAKDSATLVSHVRDVQFRYFMDWRVAWEHVRLDLYWTAEDARRLGERPPSPRSVQGTTLAPPGCGPPHIIAPTTRRGMWECPDWLGLIPPEPPDEQKGIDAAFDEVMSGTRYERAARSSSSWSIPRRRSFQATPGWPVNESGCTWIRMSQSRRFARRRNARRRRGGAACSGGKSV